MSSSSSDLPTDLLTPIFLNLPIKSLLRFKVVSLESNGLISDPFFRAMRYRSNILKVPDDSMNQYSPGALLTHVNYLQNASVTCPIDLCLMDDPRLLQEFRDTFRILSDDADGESDDELADEQKDKIRILGPYHGVYLAYDFSGNAVIWNHATREYKILSESKEYSKRSWFLLGSYEVVTKGTGEVDFVVMRIYHEESGGRVPQLFKSSIGKWKDLKPIPEDCYCPDIKYTMVCVNGIFYWLDDFEQLEHILYFDTKNETYGKLDFPTDIPLEHLYLYTVQLTCYTQNGVEFLSFWMLYKNKFDLWVKKDECWIKTRGKFVGDEAYKSLVDTKANEWLGMLTYQESLFGF